MKFHQPNTHANWRRGHLPTVATVAQNFVVTFGLLIIATQTTRALLIFPVATWTQLEKERKPSLAHTIHSFRYRGVHSLNANSSSPTDNSHWLCILSNSFWIPNTTRWKCSLNKLNYDKLLTVGALLVVDFQPAIQRPWKQNYTRKTSANLRICTRWVSTMSLDERLVQSLCPLSSLFDLWLQLFFWIHPSVVALVRRLLNPLLDHLVLSAQSFSQLVRHSLDQFDELCPLLGSFELDSSCVPRKLLC